MEAGPKIAQVAALLGDPARANMLTALMDGRALTVSELAAHAGVTLPTASGHLSKMQSAELVAAAKQGRHRYFSLSGPDVADVLEALMGLAQRTGAVRLRTGPSDAALRASRVCYDHLAGERGVALMDALLRQGLIAGGGEPSLTEAGERFFKAQGVDLLGLSRRRRPLCRYCLDWSERRGHLAGGLGAALLDRFFHAGWATRGPGRIVAFSASGARAFAETFGIPKAGMGGG